MSSGGSMVQQMPTYSYGYGYSGDAYSPCDSSGYLFNVPPPSVSYASEETTGCSMCHSCGQSVTPPTVAAPASSPQSEDEKIFALQLKAAAIFNKTDVPPPNMVDQIDHSAVVSYPPPLSSIQVSPHSTEYPILPVPTSPENQSQVGCSSGILLDGETSYQTGMKRMSDMDAEVPNKRSRSNDGIELRLLIQSKTAGSIIGKGGMNITRLRKENAASISVPDCPGPERILTIDGSEEVVLNVLEKILQSLDEASQKSGETDIRILVNQGQAGCIIGKGGKKIKELRELCEGQVKVYTECCPKSTERIVQIVSSRQKALVTIRNILAALKESPIKGLNTLYDPHNFSEYYAQDYGGWSDSPKGRYPPMGRGPPPMGPGPMSRGPMGHGPLGPPGPPQFGGRRGPHFSRGSMQSSHSPSDYDGGMRHGKSFMNGSSPQNGDLPTTTQVTIPKDTAGAIIGKGGARIRKIRADSGASISIDDPRHGSNERIITISGSDSQIRHAQYLLQQSVREYGNPSMSGRRY